MRSLIPLVLLLLVLQTKAQSIHEVDTASFVNIGKQVAYFRDASGNMSLPQVQSQNFTNGTTDVFNFGTTKDAVWLRIIYTSTSFVLPQLVFDNPNIDSIRLYYKDRSGLMHEELNGSLVSSAHWPYASTVFIFSLPHINGTVDTVYTRIRTENILVLPVKLVTHNVLAGHEIRGMIFSSVYFGIMLAVFLFTLLIYARMGESTYLRYGVYTFFLIMYVIPYSLGYSHFMPDGFLFFITRYPYVFALSGYIAAVVFAKDFLKAEQYAPLLTKSLYVIVAASVVGIVINLAGNRSISVQFVQLLGIIIALKLIALSVAVYRKGFKPAKFHGLAWTAVLLGIVYAILSFQGIIPYTTLSKQAIPIGSMIELVFLSIAMGERIKLLSVEKKAAETENLRLVNDHAASLEGTVAERTKQLQDANAVKEKLFSVVAHDVRGPLTSIQGYLEMIDSFPEEHGGAKMNEELLAITQRTTEMITDLLIWSRAQMKKNEVKMENLSLPELVNNVLALQHKMAIHKQITISTDIPGMNIYADEEMLKLVLRNMLSNAIKFSPVGGTITVAAFEAGDEMHLKLCDEGNGLTTEQQANLFSLNMGSSYGTMKEKGIGIGLVLCKEFMDKMGGRIWYQQREVKGSCFYVALKSM